MIEANLIVGAIVILLIGVALASVIINKKRGKGCCGYVKCNKCSGCGACPPDNEDEDGECCENCRKN